MYLSCDTVEEEAQQHYSTEFLNTLRPSGMPPHRIGLKLGMPFILLRNMDGSIGLVNGTRLIVRGLHRNVIDAEILTGSNVGGRVFIPRITLMPSDTDLPFQLSRRQFPILPAFGMTINKSQGQTFERVGLLLPGDVFSHGQFYVGASRVGEPGGLRVMVIGGRHEGRDGVFTRNVVYREVLV